ncbi:MAG: ATP-binding protein [Planctomycetota bacterium]
MATSLREKCWPILVELLAPGARWQSLCALLETLRKHFELDLACLVPHPADEVTGDFQGAQSEGSIDAWEVAEALDALGAAVPAPGESEVVRRGPDLPGELVEILERSGSEALTLTPLATHDGMRFVLVLAGSAELAPSPQDSEGLCDICTALASALGAEAQQRNKLLNSVRAREAMEAARAANDAKSAFLAHMSHEIRTPMTAIVGFAKLLTRPELEDGKRIEWAQTVARNADYLQALVSDILDLSKIEADQMEIDAQRCSVRELFQQVLQLMRPRAEEKGLALELVEIGQVPGSITSDSIRLRQVVLNLVSNAIKFTDQGQVRIELALEDAASEQSNYLRVSVVDSGIGIARDHIGKLFQRFQQVHTTRKSEFGGTGLGLVLVKRIVEMLGGDVFVESTPGVGSRFSFRLPVTEAEAEALAEPVSPEGEELEAADLRVLDGMSVLLADDNPTNIQLIGLLLRESGATVAEAGNGLEVINTIQAAAEPPDLVLLDMQMPILDGYSTAKRLRTLGFEAPIIALTAYAMAGDQAKCRKAGCDDFLTKPIDPDVFALLVRKRYDEHRAARPDEGPARSAPQAAMAQPDGPPSISDAVAAQVAAAQRRLAAQMAPGFIRTFPELTDQLVTARREADRSTLTSKLHQIKGTAGSFGLADISACAARGEAHLRNGGELEELDELLGELAELLQATFARAEADGSATTS